MPNLSKKVKTILFEIEPPELLEQLKGNLYVSVAISTSIVLLAAWVLFSTVPTYILLGWASIQMILAVGRIVVVRKLIASNTNKQQFRTLKLYYTAIMLFIGLSWGAATILASLYSSEVTLITLLLIIAGLTASAVSTMTPVFSGFATFFLGATLLAFIAMFISPYEDLFSMSPFVLLYT
ncbi:MAG: hypothetical protein JKY76_04925, partial [Proteobacteria bacterium]|nr:hypothetical protein [Pseudomonadota bacterium]